MLRLKEIRLAHNERQEDVAALLQITRASYANIENGKRDPDTNSLAVLADHYAVSIDELFGRRAKIKPSIHRDSLRIRSLREALGLKATEVADYLEISIEKYALYEIGDIDIPIDDLWKIANYYNTTIDNLLGRDSSKIASSESSSLSAEEKGIIVDYRNLSPQGKEYILQQMAIAIKIYGQHTSISNMAFPERIG